MPGRFLAVVIGGAAVVACLIGWFLPSMLRTSEQVVYDRAAPSVERARRLLHQYNTALAHNTNLKEEIHAVVGDLKAAGANVPNPADPSSFSDEAEEDYKKVHEAAWETFKPTQWGERPSKATVDYGNISGQAAEGVKRHAELAKQNASLLDDAMKSVDEALGVSSGDAAGRDVVEANQVKGIVYYYKGIAQALEAKALRRQAAELRTALTLMHTQATGLQPLTNILSGSMVDAQIEDITAKIAETETRLTTLKSERGKLESIIAQLDSRLKSAESRAKESLAAMEKLNAARTNDPAFANKYLALDKTYREAARDAQSISRGSLPKAFIDATGDFLSGRYIESGGAEPTREHGLQFHKNELEVLNRELAGTEGRLANLKSAKEQFEKDKTDLANNQQSTVALLTGQNGLEKQAIKTWEELSRIDSEAFALEEKALDSFQKAATSSRDASKSAEAALAASGKRYQDLSPGKQPRSADLLRKDARWLGGFIAAGEADAKLARAGIYLDRFENHGANAELFNVICRPPFPGLECKPEPEQVKSDEARSAGVQEIAGAMGVLGTVFNKVDRHWTIPALAGGARNLMVFFGYPEYLKEAIEDYDSALKGRDDKDFAAWISDRLTALRAQASGKSTSS